MNIIVSSQVSIENPPKEWSEMAEKDLQVSNPEYVRVARFASIYAERPEKYIRGYEFSQNTLIVPRAWFFTNLWTNEPFQDCTIINHKKIVDGARPLLTLLPHQMDAVTDAIKHIDACDAKELPADFSVVLATSAGKTITGLAIAYACDTPTLVVVPTQEIQKAWVTDAEKFLGIKKADIGVYRAAKVSHGKRITIASLQTLIRRHPSQWGNQYGLCIFDEVHRLNINKFILAAKNCRAAVRLGLTATLKRSDGTMPAIKWHLGNAVHTDITPRNSVPLFYHGVIRNEYMRMMSGGSDPYDDGQWASFIARLIEDKKRNDMIEALVVRILSKYGGGVLITSGRVDHIKNLVARLQARSIPTAMLIGAAEDREQLYSDILAGKYRVTVATQSIVKEGASNPNWHHLVIATPFSDEGVMEQLKGRPIRKDAGKKVAFLWDIIDNHPIAKSIGRRRFHAVKKHIQSYRWLNHQYNGTLNTHEFTGDEP